MRDHYWIRTLALCLALCACGEPKHDDSIPDIAGPCPPALEHPIKLRAARQLEDGSLLLVVSQ